MTEKSHKYLDSVKYDSFCMMPWLHLHIDTNGKVKACCTTSITYGEINENPSDIKLKEIWNGESIKAFRKKQLDGVKDKRCNACYKRETSGKSSMRTETLEKYQKFLPELINQTELDCFSTIKPSYFDIRFSNVCNLKCRTCWHGASSSWFEEAKILKNNIGDHAIIKATVNNETLVSELITFSDRIDEIYFAGGEPLMMKEHFTILKLLITKGKRETYLRYNTNLSILEFRGVNVCELWNQFENIRLSVSIDALGKQGEYIRKGLRWNKIITNLKNVIESCPHVKIEIAPTVSVFNIFSITDLHQYFVNEGYIKIDSLYLNLLDRPSYYNIMSLPVKKKQQAKKKIEDHVVWLKEHHASSNLINEFNSLIKYLFKADLSKYLNQFEEQTKLLDDLRGEDFAALFKP